MRILLLALGLAFLAAQPASASTRAENIQKCRLIDQLPDKNVKVLARSVGATVRQIREACRQLRQPVKRATPSRPKRTKPVPAPEAPEWATCHCGGGEVCVRYGMGWACEFHSSSGNRCSIQGDCGSPGSRCENGSCTR